MGLEVEVTISAIAVFLQGILSFFSPCVLPIIPLYVSYLSGGSTTIDENGEKQYNQPVILINTFFFILGISFAFFLLGLGFSSVGRFFTSNQIVFTRIGGGLIILLGLIQLGILAKPFGEKEWKLPISIDVIHMNPITAFLMGFTFSFAWTPCVGPALSTVLIMISNSQLTTGIILMTVYTIGFVIPFLLVGIFTTKCLAFFQKNGNIVRYTVKIGALLMILIGLMMLTGSMNQVTGYLFSIGSNTTEHNSQLEENNELEDKNDENMTENISNSESIVEEEEESANYDTIPAIDFSLEDQFGNLHTLTDYEGKVIFLNFWATWCPPCVQEMPDIQMLYENYGYNETDVIILGVAFPNDENSSSQEGSKQHVIDFLEENEYTYPTVMDMNGMLAYQYGISAFPTTFMIDAHGNVFGYVPGMVTYEIMESIVEQTLGITQ